MSVGAAWADLDDALAGDGVEQVARRLARRGDGRARAATCPSCGEEPEIRVCAANCLRRRIAAALRDRHRRRARGRLP